MNYDLNTLEYNKILNKLENYINTEYTLELLYKELPSNNYNKIIDKLNETEELRLLIIKNNSIPFQKLNNVNYLFEKALKDGILYEDEFNEIRKILSLIIDVKNYFKNLELKYLDKYYQNLIILKELHQKINDTIDQSNIIFDNASPNLKTIRNGINTYQTRLREKLQELLKSNQSKLSNPVITIKNDRFCLPVKVEYKNQIKGIIHDESQSGTTIYIEPISTIEINNKITNLKNDEKKEKEVILKNLTDFLKQFIDKLRNNIKLLSIIDLIHSKALFAIETNSFLPNISKNKEFNLINARHPLLDKNIVVPISIYLKQNQNSIIITGPNTGGKTLTLKTIGLFHLMLQSGLLVPCDQESTLAIFDHIYADIGDEQSIEMSLSTFSSHIKNIIRILNKINSNSLVLLDELGSGTDPNEGTELAISILDHLIDLDAKSIITSHYSKLKEYAYTNNKIVNASSEFNLETLKPTYKILMDVPGKSNALDIALKLGMDEKIIKKAKDNLIINNKDVSNLIIELENKTYELNKKLVKQDELNKKLEESINKKNKELNLFLKEKDQKLKKHLEKSQKELNNKIEELNNLIKEVTKIQKDKTNITPKLADIKNKLNDINKKDKVINPHYDFKINDIVYISSYGIEGKILKILNNNQFEILIGNIKMNFNKNDLVFIRESKEEVKKINTYKTVKVTKSGTNKLDLRGFRYEEAIYELEKFIDQSLVNGFNQIQIIHGHGTGVIRNLVTNYLKTCKHIKEYRFGVENEGLNGVTIATLK